MSTTNGNAFPTPPPLSGVFGGRVLLLCQVVVTSASCVVFTAGGESVAEGSCSRVRLAGMLIVYTFEGFAVVFSKVCGLRIVRVEP